MAKPIKIIGAILIASFAIGAGFEYNARRQYNAEGDEIRRDLDQLHALGVPITKAEFDKFFPGLSTTNYHQPSEISIPFMIHPNRQDTGSSWQVFWNATRIDQPIIEQYLEDSAGLREKVTKGGALPAHDEWQLQSVITEFLLASLAAGFKGETHRALQNLEIARRICNWSIWTDSPILTNSSLEDLFKAAIHIYELCPNMRSAILAWLDQPNFVGPRNTDELISLQFIEDAIVLEALDSPKLDRFCPPKFLQKWWKAPTVQDILNDCGDHDLDFIPKSRTARHMKVNWLRGWVAAFQEYRRKDKDLAKVFRLAKDGHDFHAISNSLYQGVCKELEWSWGLDSDCTEMRSVSKILPRILRQLDSDKTPNPSEILRSPGVDPSLFDVHVQHGTFDLEVKRWDDTRKTAFTSYRFGIPSAATEPDFSFGGMKQLTAMIAARRKRLRS